MVDFLLFGSLFDDVVILGDEAGLPDDSSSCSSSCTSSFLEDDDDDEELMITKNTRTNATVTPRMIEERLIFDKTFTR